MEHLENDMDDLFQKAGELYPLKTTGSDWDAVAGKLENEIPGDVHDLSGPAAMRTRRRRWLLLLLLIPMALGIFYYSGNIKPEHQNALTVKPRNASTDQNKKSPVVQERPLASTDNHKTAASGNMQNTSGRNKMPANSGKNGTLFIKNKKLAYVSGGKELTANNVLIPKKQISSSADKSNSDLNVNNPEKTSKETETGVANKSIDNDSHSATASVPNAEVTAVPAAIPAAKETDAAKNNTDKTEASKTASQDSSQGKKKTNTSSKQSTGFYVGLYAGPDVSTVKFQSVNNLGYSLGALIGYRINKRLSVESGLVWDKKYYYSNGEYYKKDHGIALPPTTTLDGSCSMFEIPVTIRFDFATTKNHGFFAKTGLSSYLMTSENYTFNSPAYPSVQWKNDSLRNNIFSILQISGGYERTISDKTKIRVEPYVKIPLQGIGRGDMPISSFGIYFGITHSFR
jgi:hypothetical protein